MNTNDLTNLILKTVRSSRKNEASKVLARTIKGESDSKSAPVFECININGESFSHGIYKLGDDMIYQLLPVGGIVNPYLICMTEEQIQKLGDAEKDCVTPIDSWPNMIPGYSHAYVPSDAFLQYCPEDFQEEHIEFQMDINYDGVTYPTKVIIDIEQPQEPEDTYEYVDLGLPSGTLWATCNVGANSPEEVGLYFMWGDTEGHAKDSGYDFGRDNYNAKGLNTISTDLTLEHDAANANMGGLWRMPTNEDNLELCTNCFAEWTEDYNGTGKTGVIFYSTTSNTTGKGYYKGRQNWMQMSGTSLINSSKPGGFVAYTLDTPHIFIPTAGYFNDSGSLSYESLNGTYFSSSLNPNYSGYCLNFMSNIVIPHDSCIRFFGLPVRAVKSSN